MAHAGDDEEGKETRESEGSGAGPEAFKKSVTPAPAESLPARSSGS
jgi:hypothetical protein